jgi:hypothetical protein
MTCSMIRFPLERRLPTYAFNGFGVASCRKELPREFYLETDPSLWLNAFARRGWELKDLRK